MNTSIHRLSAIVFTDIVGYTSLMGENEDNALMVLAKNKEIHEKYFTKLHATFFKQIGDGFLAVFDSVLEAAHTCGFIQNECKENNINIRAGIHQGEVIFKDKDVFGDEVNIASRIESAAAPGTIYVSENVKRNLDNKTGISIEFIKEYALKNVKDPINLYRVEVNTTSIPLISSIQKETSSKQLYKKRWLKITLSILFLCVLAFIIFRNNSFYELLNTSNKNKVLKLSENSIAVLPFQNFSKDSTMDFLGDGFADHIIINLSKIPDFKIIARSSSFRYKKSDKPANEIAEELGVQNILEGSFQTNNDNIHINLNLIHGSSGEVLYADSYNGQISTLFQLQEEVAELITNSLVGSFLKFENNDTKEQDIDLQAFKYYQFGQSKLKENYLSRNTIQESRKQFSLASKIDPDWSAPYVGMAESYFAELHYGYNIFSNLEDSIEYFVNIASSINAEQGELYSLKAVLAFWKFDFKRGRVLLNKAIELNPNYPFSYYYLAFWNLIAGNYDDALANLNKTISLDPLNGWFTTMRIIYLSFSGRHEEAIATSNQMLKNDPGENTTLMMLGIAYTNIKEYDCALNTLLKRSVGHGSNFMVGYNYAKTGQKEKARKILEYMSNLPEDRAPPWAHFSILYLGLEDYDNAILWLQKGLEKKDLWFMWMNQSWADPIKTDTRYIKIMEIWEKKINEDY